MPTIAVKDLTMHYLDQGTGEAVLFIHGNVSSSAWWRYTFERMSAMPYRLIAPDLRGRGATGGSAESFTIDTLADDIHALITALNLPQVHLVGHSLGACVAIQYALNHRNFVQSLYLLAPGWVAGDMPDAVGDPERIKMLVDNKALLKAALRMTAQKHPDEGWSALEAASMQQTDAASYRTPVALKQWNVAARLGEIGGIPTTIARGEGDTVVPESVVMDSVNGIPNAVYSVFAGATHSPNVEIPDQFVASLVAHLARA
ncbi:MAG: alpha/beta fold hydrolase [Anaerolineae bacterium]